MPKRHAADKHSSVTEVRGKVVAHNVSPKGHVEGVLVEGSTGVVQINLPKHEADQLKRKFALGSEIDAEVEFETDEGAHPVYGLVDEASETAGTVARFNYALHGEINGYHLEDDTFVHVTPKGAKKYKVRVGDRITAAGTRREGADAVVLEAETVQKQSKRDA